MRRRAAFGGIRIWLEGLNRAKFAERKFSRPKFECPKLWHPEFSVLRARIASSRIQFQFEPAF